MRRVLAQPAPEEEAGVAFTGRSRAGLGGEEFSLRISRTLPRPSGSDDDGLARRDRKQEGTNAHRPAEPGRERSERLFLFHVSEEDGFLTASEASN